MTFCFGINIKEKIAKNGVLRLYLNSEANFQMSSTQSNFASHEMMKTHLTFYYFIRFI